MSPVGCAHRPPALSVGDKQRHLMNRTKVLWLTKGLGRGGMEVLLVHHAKFGDHEAFEYHAAYAVDRPNNVIDELADSGVTIHSLAQGRLGSNGWGAELVRLIRKERFDIVHCHSPAIAAMERCILKTMPNAPKLVYTEHNIWTSYHPFTRLMHGLTMRADNHRLAVSQAASETPPRWTGSRSEVLIHGIDVDGVHDRIARRSEVRAELGLTEDQFVVAHVANLRKEKAHSVMMKAAELLLRSEPSAVVLAIGDGVPPRELTQLHSTLRLGDSFRFLGFRSDVIDLMAAADVLGLSSDVEGLPVAVMEAKALGLPVVSTAVGGIPLEVANGVDGILVARRDSDELGAALVRCASDRAFRDLLGRNSLASSSKYRSERAILRIEETYRTVMR